MWSVVRWILFLLLLFLFRPTRLTLQPMSGGTFTVWILVIALLRKVAHVEIPTAVFWVLFVLLLHSLLVSRSIALVLYWMLVISHLHITAPSLHPQLLPVAFWISSVLLIALLHAHRMSAACFVLWVAIAAVLRDRIHSQMSLGWWAAWIWLFSVLTTALPLEMPIVWSVIWVLLIPLLGLAMHPEMSLSRFVLWTALIFILRLILYPVYLFYYYSPEKDVLFPFNFVSSKWRRSRTRWYPISTRPTSAEALCGRCDRFTTKSKLIMGSKDFLAGLVEWYEFWDSFQELQRSALDLDPPCHLCHLFWHSISEQRREEIAAGQRWPSASSEWKGRQLSSSGNVFSANSDEAPQRSTVGLRVKVWEERPLSLHTYAQLFWGDIAVGARLLIRREKLFQEPSTACQVSSTESDEHIEQAKEWLAKCTASHTLCNGAGDAPRALPTRLIHLASASPSEPIESPSAVRLVVTDTAKSEIRYLAFSHCWGDSRPFRLLKSNFDACLQSIEYSKLSKNMQDAIRITQRLGFSYIWIDSLCIIQDADEDWATEASKMGSVYSGATCTIASTGSSSSDGGCFHQRQPLSLRPCKIEVLSSDSLSCDWIYARRDDVFDFERSVDKSPLNKRAWVLQERLLSHRILHFGAEMIYWECCQRSASELNPSGYIYKRYPEDFSDNYFPGSLDLNTRTDVERAETAGTGLIWAGTEMMRKRPPPPAIDPDDPLTTQAGWQRQRGFWKEVRKPSSASWTEDSESTDGSGFRAAFEKLKNKTFSEDQVGMSSFSQCWYEIVESYTRCQLTYSKDKLIAISGLVRHIEEATRFTYVAGLWKEYLLTDLLWFVPEGPGHRLFEAPPIKLADPAPAVGKGELETLHTGEVGPKQTPYMAPTWSWASLDGTVALDLLPDNSIRKIILKHSLITRLNATVSPSKRFGQSDTSGNVSAGIPEIEGQLCAISKVISDGIIWLIEIGKLGRPSARFFPDVAEDDLKSDPKLFCLSCLVLSRESENRMIVSYNEEIQGLALRRLEKRAGSPDVFERVGFFTTSRMTKVSSSRKQLKEAVVRLIHII